MNQSEAIHYDEEQENYIVTCPYCGHSFAVGEESDACGHLIYAYNAGEQQLLYADMDLEEALARALIEKPETVESFPEFLMDNYDLNVTDPAEEIEGFMVNEYIDDGYCSSADLFEILRSSEKKDNLEKMTVCTLSNDNTGEETTYIFYAGSFF